MESNEAHGIDINKLIKLSETAKKAAIATALSDPRFPLLKRGE